MVTDQVWKAVHVIVVHMAGHGDVHGLHPVITLEPVDAVLHEADAVRSRRGALEVAEVKPEADP